jgi:DNA-binding PadR family transcriptional regulator
MPSVSPTTEALRPSQDLLTAWLLLLLDGGDSHGYDLCRRLADACVAVDRSIMYRRLRTLEEHGCVTSHWASPAGGPRRRVYVLTCAGRRDLDELVQRIHATRGGMTALLDAHRRAREIGAQR